GPSTFPYQMSSSGLSALSATCNSAMPCSTSPSIYNAQRDTALTQMLSDTYANPLTQEYANTFKRGRDLYGSLNSALTATDGSGNVTTAFDNNSLANQLKMVARMIKISRAKNFANRQIFYVRFGGFDLHDGLMSTGTSGHAALLSVVSKAMNQFW